MDKYYFIIAFEKEAVYERIIRKDEGSLFGVQFIIQLPDTGTDRTKINDQPYCNEYRNEDNSKSDQTFIRNPAVQTVKQQII